MGIFFFSPLAFPRLNLFFHFPTGQSHTYAVIFLPVALLFIVYACVTYVWRSKLIRERASDRWDDPVGPVILTVLLILALLLQFFLKLYDILLNGL